MKLRAFIAFALASCLTSTPALSAPAPYRLEYLGQFFYPHAINDRGQIAGADIRNRLEGPALLWEAGSVTPLGIGQGHDINNGGTIVLGVPVYPPGTFGAVVLAPDGSRTPSGLPQGWGNDIFAHRFSINSAGQVVGMQKHPDPDSSDGRAFLWDQRGITYLDAELATQRSSARAINDAGQVAGWYLTDRNTFAGFLWHDGATTLLPAPAVSINSMGQVLLSDGRLWQSAQTTPIPRLPVLPGSDELPAPPPTLSEMNDAGQVVGWSEETYLISAEFGHGTFDRGFLWDATTGLTDLNAVMGLGPDDLNNFPLAQPLDINNAGQIIGYGPLGGWLLTPVPEPSSALLLAAACLATFRRRSRSA